MPSSNPANVEPQTAFDEQQPFARGDHLMAARCACLLLVFSATASAAAAQPDPKTADDKALVTTVCGSIFRTVRNESV